jgi:hypothetical protein
VKENLDADFTRERLCGTHLLGYEPGGYSGTMSWLKVAFGIIREAAGTELGKEVIGNIRSTGKNKNSEPSPAPLDVEALLAEHRAQTDRNLEAVVALVNQQNSRLDASLRRQRVWNFALAAGLVIALVLAIAAAR